MRKQQNYDDAANALDFVESCEKTCAHLEQWCEQQVLRYTGESWPKGFAAEQMKPSLQAYVNAAAHRQIRTKDNAENFAWRVAVAKFAERLAERYGVELN